MNRSLFSILFILCCQAAMGQFNDTIHHHFFFSSTGIINKTNDGNSFVLNNVMRYSLNKKIMTLNSSNSWVYGEQEVRKTNNDFNSVLDFDIYKNVRKLYYWGLGSYDKSFSLKINDRLQVGAGLGYTILKSPTATLVFSDGLIYERSDLVKADQTNDQYSTLRNSARLKFRWVIKDMLVIDGLNFLQNSLSDKKDYIIKSNTSASLKLRKWLNFTTSVNYNKLTRTDRENLLITFGIAIEQYF